MMMHTQYSALNMIWLTYYILTARCSDSENLQFSYIDELTASAQHWPDQRKFVWFEGDCDFTTECGFGSMPVSSLDGKWHTPVAGTWRVYKENFGSESTGTTETKSTTGLGYRSRGPSETYLFSDPVPCLEAKTASVRAKVRLFGDSHFRICLVSLDNGTNHCGTTIEPRGHKYSAYNLEQPIPDIDGFSGSVIIRIEFIAKNSAFVLIERIGYVGQKCIVPHGQKEKDPTEVMKFQLFKLNADFVTIQSILAVIPSAFDRFILNLDTFKLSSHVFHLCKALRCHTTKDLCLYNGQYGSIIFETVWNNIDSERKVLMTNKHHAKAMFQPGKVDFAVLASEKFVNGHTADVNFKHHRGSYFWQFLANEAAHKRNKTICFILRYPHTTDPPCIEPFLYNFDEETKLYTYMALIPINATEFRLVIWQPQNFQYRDHEAEAIIRGINVIGC